MLMYLNKLIVWRAMLLYLIVSEYSAMLLYLIVSE